MAAKKRRAKRKVTPVTPLFCGMGTLTILAGGREVEFRAPGPGPRLNEIVVRFEVKKSTVTFEAV